MNISCKRETSTVKQCTVTKYLKRHGGVKQHAKPDIPDENKWYELLFTFVATGDNCENQVCGATGFCCSCGFGSTPLHCMAHALVENGYT